MDIKTIQEKIEAITPVPQEKETSDGNHIFFTILKKNKSFLSPNDHLRLLYYYSYCEKALNEHRSNNVEIAKWYLSKVDCGVLNLQEQWAKDMQIIYDPVLSYGLYLEKDFDGAFKHLMISIKQIDECLKNGASASEFLKAKLEQTLNVFRIFVAQKDISKATDCADDLLGYMLFQRKNGLFKDQADITKAIEKMEYEWPELTEYFFNAIILKYVLMVESGMVKEMDFFPELFKNLLPENISGYMLPIYKGIALMNDYYASDFDAFINGFIQIEASELSLMPLAIKYLIVSKVIRLMQKDGKMDTQALLQSFINNNDLNGNLAKIQSKEVLTGEA